MPFSYIIRIDFLAVAHDPISRCSRRQSNIREFQGKSNTVCVIRARCDRSNLHVTIVTDGGKRFAPKIGKTIRWDGFDEDQVRSDREISALHCAMLRCAAVRCRPLPPRRETINADNQSNYDGVYPWPLPYLSAAILGRDNRTTSLL